MTRLIQASAVILRPPCTNMVAWHLDHGAVICLVCQISLGDRVVAIYNHLCSTHRAINSNLYLEVQNQVDAWNRRQEGIPFTKLNTNTILERPVEGLRVVTIYVCGDCDKRCNSYRTLQYHCHNFKHSLVEAKVYNANTLTMYDVFLPIIPSPSSVHPLTMSVFAAGVRHFNTETNDVVDTVGVFFGKAHHMNFAIAMDHPHTSVDFVPLKAVAVALNLCKMSPMVPEHITLYTNRFYVYRVLKQQVACVTHALLVEQIKDSIKELQGLGVKEVEFVHSSTCGSMGSAINLAIAKVK